METNNTNTAAIETLMSARTAKKLMNKWGKLEGAERFLAVYGKDKTEALRMAQNYKMVELVEMQKAQIAARGW